MVRHTLHIQLPKGPLGELKGPSAYYVWPLQEATVTLDGQTNTAHGATHM